MSASGRPPDSAGWARMWEARVAPGRLVEAADWVRGLAVPAALAAGAVDAEGFAAGGGAERVVLITRWADRTAAESYVEGVPPGPPGALLARADAWVFEVLPPAAPAP